MNIGVICAALLATLPCYILAVCPDVRTMENFDPQRFTGRWYEISKYPNVWEAGQKCITADYQLNQNGTIDVLNRGVYRLINYPVSVHGLARPNATNPAKMTIQFSRFGRIMGRGRLWVLETDYQNYALLYSCYTAPLIPINIENAWIMSRRPTLDEQIVDLLKSRLDEADSSTFMLFKTDQSNCEDNYDL